MNPLMHVLPMGIHLFFAIMGNSCLTPINILLISIFDFEVIIPDEKQDKNLAKRIISKELSGIFNWVLEGLDRLLKQQQFTESPKAKSLLEEMRLESDSVAQFMAARQYIPSVSEEDKEPEI